MYIHRCLKCEKEFDLLKQYSCCKGAKSVEVALNMTREEMKAAVEESEDDVWEWLFNSRKEIEALQKNKKRMQDSIKVAVKELNRLDYNI